MGAEPLLHKPSMEVVYFQCWFGFVPNCLSCRTNELPLMLRYNKKLCRRHRSSNIFSNIVLVVWCFFSFSTNASGASSGRGFVSSVEARRVFPVEWLHIPKTGSSFGNVLLRWACGHNITNIVQPGGGFSISPKCQGVFRLREEARETWPIGDHIPIPKNASVFYLHHLLTFIRSPSSRALSHRIHLEKKADETLPLCNFLSKYNMFGFQTGWILGSKGRGYLHLTHSEQALACHRLHFFAFVGITDFWDASICLFHKEFGGFDLDADSANVRLGKYNHTAASSLLEQGCEDEADEHLFQCALDLFLSRLSKTVCINLLYNRDLGSSLSNQKLQYTLELIPHHLQ